MITPSFSLNTLNEEAVDRTFIGLSRVTYELVYFDKLKGDVLSLYDGYLSSHTGDQTIENRRLAEKIENNAPKDFVDSERYILIGRLSLEKFLKEYEKQAGGKEPFASFVRNFSVKILQHPSFKGLSLKELFIGSAIESNFHESFNEQYYNRAAELKDDYVSIYLKTCKQLSLNWIQVNILK